MRSRLKIIALIILAAFVAWLIISPSNNRLQKLRQAVKEGALVDLTDTESRNLDSLIRQLVRISGIQQTISINKLPGEQTDIRQTLNFLVTTPDLSDITYCNKGNAIYDAGLNTIFIDLSIVRPSAWMLYDPDSGIQLNEGDLPFLKTYLAFILLHELGHYKLHGQSGGFFDFAFSKDTVTDRKREREADGYAVGNIAKYLSLDTASDYYKNIGQQIDLSAGDASPATRSVIALLEMSNAMLLGMLYGLSPYSPFFSDAAHPTYITRTLSLLDPILADNTLPPGILSKAAFIYVTLKKIDELGRNGQLESRIVPQPILDVNFGRQEVVALSLSGNEYYRLDLNPKWSEEVEIRKPVPFYDSSDRVQLVHTDDKIYCLKEKNELYELKDTSFTKVATGPLFSVLQNENWFQVPDALRSNIIFRDSLISRYTPDGVISARYEEIKQKVIAASGIADIDIRYYEPVFNTNKIGLEVYRFIGEKQTLAGMCFIQRKDLQFSGFTPLTVPEGFFNKPSGETQFSRDENLLLFDDDTEQLFVTKFARNGDVAMGWELYKAPPGNPPVKLASFPFLTGSLQSKALPAYYSPYMYKERFALLSRNKYIINYNGDCVFLLDLDKGKAGEIFYPGDENLHIRVNEEGDMLFFIRGLRKFYIFRHS
jgi:hypothetical protein